MMTHRRHLFLPTLIMTLVGVFFIGCGDINVSSSDPCKTNPDHEACQPGSDADTETESDTDTVAGTDTDTAACVPDCTGKFCGDDGCGGSCGVCSAGQICVDGICMLEKACRDLYICVIGTPGCGLQPLNTGCMSACTEGATENAMEQWSEVGECFTTCDLKGACVAANCAEPAAQCASEKNGFLDCKGIQSCVSENCDATSKDGAACQWDCFDKGSLGGQTKLTGWMLCLRFACSPGGGSVDGTCILKAGAPGGLCESYKNACVPNEVDPSFPSG